MIENQENSDIQGFENPYLPPCPDYLDGFGRELWDELIVDVLDLRYSESAKYVLSVLCDSYSKWRHAQFELSQTGLTITTPNGCLQASPYVSIARTASDQMLKYTKQLGLPAINREN